MITKIRRPEQGLLHLAILLTGVALIFSCEQNSDPGKGEDKSPVGEWAIEEFTGSINNKRETGIPLLCDAYNETYFPLLGEDQSYIRIVEIKKEPDFEHIPTSVFDTYKLDSEGLVFIFHISFDNGYYTNDVLEGIGVQGAYESFFGDAWSTAIGVYTDSEISIADVVGVSESGTSGGGYNRFIMEGKLISSTRIEGTWSWTETTQWPDINAQECNTQGTGEGTWIAVKK